MTPENCDDEYMRISNHSLRDAYTIICVHNLVEVWLISFLMQGSQVCEGHVQMKKDAPASTRRRLHGR